MSINYLGRGILKSHARIIGRIRWGMRSSQSESHDSIIAEGMRIQPPRKQRLIRSSDRMNGSNVTPANATARTFRLAADCSHGKDSDCSSKDDRQSGKVCPERKLAVAVFSQAANDLRKFRYARRGTGYSLYADARNWITSNDQMAVLVPKSL